MVAIAGLGASALAASSHLINRASAPPKPADFPDPEPCSGACGYVHDPNVVQDGNNGTFYRYATFGNIMVASAPSLNGPWTSLPDPAIPPSSEPTDDYWAPNVIQVGNTWYMYYAVSGGGQNSAIGVATTTDLASNQWTDMGNLSIPASPDYNLIDANLLVAPDNSLYFTFGSAWQDIFQLPFSDPTTPSGTPTQIAFNTSTIAFANIVEGSFQFWYPVGGTTYYYLFFSSGACCNTPPGLLPAGQEYKTMVCRSESPTGPFTDANGLACTSEGDGTGTLVLGSHGANVYAPGGEGIIQLGDGTLALYYHYVNPNIGYDTESFQFGWNKMAFDDDGWPYVYAD